MVRDGNERAMDGQERGDGNGGREGEERTVDLSFTMIVVAHGEIAIEFGSTILKSSAPPAASSSRWLQLLIGGRPTWVRV